MDAEAIGARARSARENRQAAATQVVRKARFDAAAHSRLHRSSCSSRAFLEPWHRAPGRRSSIGEDYHLGLTCLLEGARFVVSSETLYKYRVRDGSLSWRLRTADIDQLLRSHDELGIERRFGGDAQILEAAGVYRRSLVTAREVASAIEQAKRGRWQRRAYECGGPSRTWPLLARFADQAAAKKAWRPMTRLSDIAAPPPRIAVCVCAYNRPDGLKALLGALDRQRLGKLPDGSLEIVVIDNNVAGQRRRCLAARTAASFASPITFAPKKHEPRKGLAFARNAALAAALQPAVTHIAFIDDDELPSPTGSFLSSQRSNGKRPAPPSAPCFRCLQRRRRSGFPSWLMAICASPRTASSRTATPATPSSRAQPSMRLSLSFDARFNDTGGEDTMFFKRLTDGGGKIA